MTPDLKKFVLPPMSQSLNLLADILAREFRLALPEARSQWLGISWPEGVDEIRVLVGGDQLYVMTITSDDDEFRFELREGRECKNDRIIRFDFPADWFEASEATTVRQGALYVR